jgi:hypothetical protein
MTHKLIKTDNYLLVVDDSEIKVGDNCLCDIPAGDYFGVVAYNGAFAEHYYKKIIAHLPLNGLPILEGVDLLPPIEDDVEQLAEISSELQEGTYTIQHKITYKHGFKDGYNKALEKYKYTEEDIIHLLHKTARKYFQEGREYKGNMAIAGDPLHGVRRELINMVQSLHHHPAEFETEDVLTPSEIFYPNDVPYSSPKTITTAQAVQWVGKYK